MKPQHVQNKIFLLIFSSLFVFLICSILSSFPSQETSRFSLNFLPKLTKQSRVLAVCPANETLIGKIDTFDFEDLPKFLKLDVFDIPVQNQMIVKCYLDASCSFEQVLKINNDLVVYMPKVEMLIASRLPKFWQSLSMLNVIVLRNSGQFASLMAKVVKDLEMTMKNLAQFKQATDQKMQEFVDATLAMTVEKLGTLSEEILLQLNDENSDLSLQFQNLLAGSFNIVVGLYLQEISSDFLYFQTELTNRFTAIKNDILINKIALSAHSNRAFILENIQKVTQGYSDLGDEYIAQFNHYKEIEQNWGTIIHDQIQLTVIDKFEFANENITVAVKNFLLMILEGKRNLVNQTGSLVFQQFGQYQGSLSEGFIANKLCLQTVLNELRDYLALDCNPISTDAINSIFMMEELRNTLLKFDHSIDALDKLKKITTVQFQYVLEQFKAIFLLFITNLPGILQAIKDAFECSYPSFKANMDQLMQQLDVQFIADMGKILEDFQKTASTLEMLTKLKNQNYELNSEEMVIYQEYNIFNDTIVPSFTDIQQKIAEIKSVAIIAVAYFEEFKLQKTYNLSSSSMSADIINNITGFITEIATQQNNIIVKFKAQFNLILTEFKLNCTDSFTDFFAGLIVYIENNQNIALKIVQAVLTNNFNILDMLDAETVLGLKAKFFDTFNETFNTSLSENPLEFTDSYQEVHVNYSYHGLQSLLKLKFSYHHIVNSFYGVQKGDFETQFFFKLVPFVEVHVDITNELQELFLMREVLVTSLDFIKGKLPLSYNLNANFVEGYKVITKEFTEEYNMDPLKVKVDQDISFFLNGNKTEVDPILMEDTEEFGCNKFSYSSSVKL